jgi:thiamine biosynthesis lipoprotein
MGTLFEITLFATNQAVAETAAEAAFRRINALEEIMSDYQADSELNLLCQKPAGVPVPVSLELFDVLSKSQEFARRTDGAFDATVGPYVRLWRFARKRHILPTQTEIAEARAASGWRKLKLDSKTRTVTLLAEHMRLDLGGIAKGYAADAAIDVLSKHGIDRALVAASGDIAVSKAPPGKKAWSVEISGLNQKLKQPLLLENAAVSTSGDTEQFIEVDGVRYSHIVSPWTGLGLTNRIQATIISRHATTTDALGTAVCVMGAKRGLKVVNSIPRTGALVITKDTASIQAHPSKRWGQLTGQKVQ